MPLILAIEPDRRQAAKIAALARGPLNVELLVTESTERAIAALGERVPDLILTSLLLSPKDEMALADRLRELDVVGAHVQTLTIPVLGAPARRSRAPSGLLTRLRRPQTKDAAPDGCDPAVFGAQIAEYLERVAAERAILAAREYVETTPAIHVEPPSKEATPPIEVQAPAHVIEAFADFVEAPADVIKASADLIEAPADLSHAPAELARTPANLSEAHADLSMAPTDLGQAPADLARAPANLIEASVDLSEAFADLVEASADLVGASPDLIEAPADLVQAPADLIETSADFSEAPAANLVEASADLSEAFANLIETSADLVAAPADFIESSADLVETPTSATEAPVDYAELARQEARQEELEADDAASLVELVAEDVAGTSEPRFVIDLEPIDLTAFVAELEAAVVTPAFEIRRADPVVAEPIGELTVEPVAHGEAVVDDEAVVDQVETIADSELRMALPFAVQGARPGPDRVSTEEPVPQGDETWQDAATEVELTSAGEPHISDATPAANLDLWTAPPVAARHSGPRLEGVPAKPPAPIVPVPELPHVVAAASPEPAQPPAQPELLEMLTAIRYDIERLRADRAEAPAASPVAAEPAAPVEVPLAAVPAPPAPTVGRKKKRPKAPAQVQDEWGFFDPEQCGFAALLAKLEEVTEGEGAAVKRPG